MNWSEKLVVKGDFISRNLGDEIVLMSKDGQEIHSFEDSGLLVWQHISEGKTPREILDSILEEYDVSEDQARSDLEVFFKDLRDKGIAEPANG